MKTLYTNGTILTLDQYPVQDALLEENGYIVKVGSRADILPSVNDAYQEVDLEGKTMMPSFMDAHSHLSSYASSFLQASLEDATDFETMIQMLKDFANAQGLQEGDWLIAGSYDHNKLKEKKHPTKEMLDEAFPGLHVVLQHQSGHFGVMNTKAFAALGLIGQDQNGYLEENAWVASVKQLPLPSSAQLLKAYKMAFRKYASFGITTVQEGVMVKPMVQMMQLLMDQNAFDLDVVGYPEIQDADVFYGAFKESDNTYFRNFKLGGYKIILDGSPQGRTAWMRTAYLGDANAYGVSSMHDAQVYEALAKAVGEGRQLLSHCNGDRAAQQLLEAANKIGDSKAVASIRPVIVHAQLLGKDQLDDVKKNGFIPSFFVAHTYHWGDIHIQNFGLERAKKISPAHSALEKEIPFTFHQDTPVIQPDMFETIWCAAKRMTKNGIILGEDERVSVKEAVKAVTINAAYQYGEENLKGTLTQGKLANFILVDENPFKIPVDEIRNIQILKTYKEGKCVYAK